MYKYIHIKILTENSEFSPQITSFNFLVGAHPATPITNKQGKYVSDFNVT